MPRRRTIAVVTGSRAEFGLLHTVMKAIEAHPRLQLRTIVAGLHLVTGTWRDVSREYPEERGFTIDAKVRMQRAGLSPASRAVRSPVPPRLADVQSVSRGVAGFGKVFAELQPDAVLVLGDRIEAFAAATAASIGGIRVAHVHGGDRAEGVADEAMRHAISKLAHIHFPATAQSRNRLIRMGERGEHVFNVGSPAMDALRNVKPDPHPPAFVIIQHPIGECDQQERRWMNQTLDAVWDAMGEFPEDTWCLALTPNADPGSTGICRALDLKPGEGHVPRAAFLSFLAGAKAIIGNSSAGLIEAAALKVPCVNIGPRQNGREKPANVVDCDYGEQDVRRAVRKALKLDLRRMRHPYGDGRTGQRMADLLATMDLEAVPIRKQNVY